jgi:hypothetical protein
MRRVKRVGEAALVRLAVARREGLEPPIPRFEEPKKSKK